MATEYTVTITGQPFFHSSKSRTFEVFFTEPEAGIAPSTGILLLISGFEGDAKSNVYTKMRKEFSDLKDFVVIQCNYFGYQFMGAESMTKVRALFAEMSDEFYSGRQDVYAERELYLAENPDAFCELGIFQALDNLKAVKKIIDEIMRRGLVFDYNRILAYGFSHGAYLALLCNAWMPGLFSGVIDNSGWIYPVYLYRPRICSEKWDGAEDGKEILLFVKVHYQGKQWIDDLEIYNLGRIYSQFDNHARILSFHGAKDRLISLHEKTRFLSKINHSQQVVVHEQDVDGRLFKNTKHGMGSDFLALFYLADMICPMKRELDECVSLEDIFQTRTLETRKYSYSISEELEIVRHKK